MTSLAMLQPTAPARIEEDTDPQKHYAYRTYDVAPLERDGGLRPEDIFAANLLSLRLGWRQVIPLFAAVTGGRNGSSLD